MKAEHTPITLEDLKLTLADAKLIRDGAAEFLAPEPDPRDDERYLDPEVDAAPE
jgi:hypothetical protein